MGLYEQWAFSRQGVATIASDLICIDMWQNLEPSAISHRRPAEKPARANPNASSFESRTDQIDLLACEPIIIHDENLVTALIHCPVLGTIASYPYVRSRRI